MLLENFPSNDIIFAWGPTLIEMTLIAIIQRRLRQHRIIPVEVASPAATAAEVKERSFGGAPIDPRTSGLNQGIMC